MAIHFVTGKGGVGKTRVSLLLHQDLKSSVITESHEGGLNAENEWIKIIDPKIVLFPKQKLFSEFIEETIKIPFVRSLIAKTSLTQSLLNLAPNLYELLVLREWIRVAKSKTLIVDAPSSGNFLSLLDCVKTAISVFDGGSMLNIANEVQKYFKNDAVYVHIVSLPENSALCEMREIEEGIKKRYSNFKISKILNRLHPSTIPISDLSPRLTAIQNERPQRELLRTKSIQFEKTLFEGASSL